jgi:AcrR family transcriptional regulator
VTDERPGTGLGRRRRRISDEETVQRMLQAALAIVNRSGLTVSLDHLSFEDVIRDAGVTRSAVYRHWPYKDLFFSDLLREIARATSPAAALDFEAEAATARQIVLDHLDWLETPAGRHDLLVEIHRVVTLEEFESIHRSREWRTYLALHATYFGLADGELREDVRGALADSERRFVDFVANSREQTAALFGYRLRPELGGTFTTLGRLIVSTLRGQVIGALSTPDIETRRVRAKPFGATREADWSEPALAIGSLVFAFLEPDPTVEWDEERVEHLRRTLFSGEIPQL